MFLLSLFGAVVRFNVFETHCFNDVSVAGLGLIQFEEEVFLVFILLVVELHLFRLERLCFFPRLFLGDLLLHNLLLPLSLFSIGCLNVVKEHRVLQLGAQVFILLTFRLIAL